VKTRIGADVGGTFTDVILQEPDGTVHIKKVLSTPPHYDRAVVAGVRDLLTAAGTQPADVVHGTTVPTNAVLERRGALTALVTTAGFRDVLELRRVRMPHLYDLFWQKPRPLIERYLRFEVNERVTAAGDVLQALDESEVREVAARLRSHGVESVAVCFLHAHRHPHHEQQAGAILRTELPGVAVTLSSDVIREQQEYERTAATAVNAYVKPLMGAYVDDLRAGLTGIGIHSPLSIMQSSGGVMSASDAADRPVYALESGPAAGVVAALALAERLGIRNAIAFDMGGTTAKASLIENNHISRSREYEIGADLSAGTRLLRGSGELVRIPTIDIAEVGAGGGSVVWLDDGDGLHVGPRSAGAVPGPACYGNGGTEPTVTDANVVLGLIPSGRLASGDLVVSSELAESAIRGVAERVGLATIDMARAIHRLANASMMRALRAVSSEKGRDPREFALIAYGGSGPVHAATLADELGIRTVLVPPIAGLFSATGLLNARTEFHDVRFCEVDARAGDVDLLNRLDGEMRKSLAAAIGDVGELLWQRSADMRYEGQSWDIEIELSNDGLDQHALAELVERFEAEHERTYGVRHDPGAPVVIRALRLAVIGADPETQPAQIAVEAPSLGSSSRVAALAADPELVDAKVVSRASVAVVPTSGPLLIDEYDTTVVVPHGWSVRRESSGTLLLEREGTQRKAREAQHDQVAHQIVAHALASIADEMATTIFRTAHSTIVRDVMDFSAALCGPTGETVAQAVTLPNHLGSIPTAMAALQASYGEDLRPGDIFVMNDPFDGGIHTSDIYVVKPLYHDRAHIGFAVTTAHHGDVGGRLPGTTACDNTEVFQEGLRLPWLPLYRDGKPVEEIFKIIRANVRIPSMTLGDLRAQIAACTIAERGLQELAERYGVAPLCETMGALIDHSEQIVRRHIASWPDGTARFTDYLDSDGIEEGSVPIAVEVTIRGDEIVADFSESAPMVRGALNSTKSFVEANVYQAVISAVEQQIPSTSGAFRPITVITKPGTITHVVLPGASSMRGVTGFRIFDALNGALAQLIPDRIPAAGEGGNTLAIFSGLRPDGELFVYYELVVGTWGACPTNDGNDGLSNPCATAANIPVEVAESEFPILIERYGLVPDSGGPGRYRGGLAIERSWRVLGPQTSLQVRSDRQRHRPYGLAGGEDGAASMNFLSDGSATTRMPPMFSTTVTNGLVFHHRMAGGGGWGDPLERDPEAVARDVRDDKVTAGNARDRYGVALTDGGTPDLEQTRQLRARMRLDRKEHVA
jgi:N-methylhydantoinase A/oxoprolinase/acetone carboxylase beta subunit/N-methylhydantoinase B/oxoprolinase/acetone carboxylase alpha subunit